MPVRVAVLGASGRIGRLVAARLASVPDVELTLSSRHRPPAHAPEGGRWVRCDLTDTARLVEVLTGQDVVVAAVDGDLDAISGSLVAAMTGAGVRRLLWVTGLGIHHEITGPTGRMFARLADAAPTVVTAADHIAASDLDYTLLRCPALTDDADDRYEFVPLGQQPRIWHVSRTAVAHAIADIIIDTPGCYLRQSIALTGTTHSRAARIGLGGATRP